MALARLILHPRQVDQSPADKHKLITALGDIGFIESEPANKHFLPGKQFINLLSFLGCSPEIHLHPDDGNNYCFIQINEGLGLPTCLGHTTSVIPRCPVCKNSIRDWRHIPDWQQAETIYQCDNCQSKTAMSQLRWRQECAYGRFSIDVAHIHPHEAVPAEKLLAMLESTSGFAWDYAYANEW